MIRWKNANWLFVATTFTTAYLLFVVFWIGPTKIIEFTETDELNAIGDFLAGVFSPLAFIWLVAAVLTQRQELTDTRDQFAENQKVVDAQLTTINQQSGLLQQQHSLAEETAKKTYRLSLFDQRFAIYNELVALHSKMEKGGLSARNLTEIQLIAAKSSFVFGQRVSNYFDDLLESVVSHYNYQEDNRKAWSIDALTDAYSVNSEHVQIRQLHLSEKLRIINLLESESLRELLWDDMRVSDS